MAASIGYEFDKAASSAKSWRDKLQDMQTRAGEALQKAQTAQGVKEDAQLKIDGLKQEAAKDDSPDPIIWVKINGLFGGGGLEGEIVDAEADIAAAQKVVDEIRDEYSRESSAVISSYALLSVEGIYALESNRSRGGNPFSSSDEVISRFGEFDVVALTKAFGAARKSPEHMPALLNILSKISAEEIQIYFLAYPEHAIFPTNPMGGDNVQRAKDVQKWWNAGAPEFDAEGRIVGSADAQEPGYGVLSEEQRLALLTYAPGLVGNTQGVQYTYRSEANLNLLSVLSSDSAHSRGIPLSIEELAIPQGVRDAASNALGHYEALKGEGKEAQIITFEVNTAPLDKFHWDDVKAAISVGNLDEAESASYLTHGIDNNAQENLSSHMDAATSLYNQEKRIFEQNQQPDKKHAVVAWMNYEAPEGPFDGDLSVLDNDKAYAGGQRYAQDLDTLNTLRGEETIRLNTVAHSYGTGVTFAGMTEMKTKVDSAVFLGSAGLPQGLTKAVRAGEQHLAVDLEDIAHTRASEDLTAWMGYGKWLNKERPATLEGSTKLSADGGYSSDGHYFQDTDGHALYDENGLEGYLKEGTSARYQTALWTTGHGDQVGQFLDYVDPSDQQIRERGSNSYTYGPTNDRKDMSSTEDIEKLQEYARAHGIDWDSLQQGNPTGGK